MCGLKLRDAQRGLKKAQKSAILPCISNKKYVERAMISAFALGAKGIMFVPDEGAKTVPRLMIRRSNDNEAQAEQQ